MKIVLSAFGKLRSDPIDVPEETPVTATFRLVYPYDNRPRLKEEPLPSSGGPSYLYAEFRWNGSYLPTGEEEWPKIYELIDIWKEGRNE